MLDRTTVGVLHVFNKKYGGIFVDEDVRLLEQLAKQGAAVIASAQMYREVVAEKQELLHTIDSLYAGLLMVGTNGRLVQINPSARAILGISAQMPVCRCSPGRCSCRCSHPLHPDTRTCFRQRGGG